MADVDDFLLQQIFVRLPVKSVHRFKCVSKHWLSLISDTHFAHQYVQFQSSRADVDEVDAYKNLSKTTFIYMKRSSSIPRCLDFPSSNAFEFEGFSFDFIPTKFQQLHLKLLAASHGWILCSSENSNSWARLCSGWEIDYHLCSPLFKQWIDIPRSPIPENLIRLINIMRPCLIGFICEDDDLISSFSSISNNGTAGKPIQFKVVKIFSCFLKSIVCIFSSERWEWSISMIANSAKLIDNCWKPCMVSCDGTLYWITNMHTCVFALDLSNDGDGLPLRRICMPAWDHIVVKVVQLGHCNGELHLALWSDQVYRHGNVLSIFQLGKEGNADFRWSLKHEMKLDGLDFTLYYVKMFKFAPLEDVVYIALTTKKVVRVNLKNKTVTKIDCDDSIESSVTFALPYWPLLHSPDS